jgi:transposase
MQNASINLPNSVKTLQDLLTQKDSELEQKAFELQKKDLEIETLKQRYQAILEQFRLAQQKRFGKSSEVSAAQLSLFNEAEQILEESTESTVEEETQPAIAPVRNRPKRQPLPKDLPREILMHDIAEADKTCACCGGALHKMGEQRSEQLEFIPAQIKVIEHIRPQYSCRHCEQTGIQTDIKIALVPPAPIPRSFATPSLLSQIISSKYQYSLPLYRQESFFAQIGIELSRQTMADWMIKCAELFKPLYQHLHDILLQQPVIHADETPLTVIREDKTHCYMWLYCCGRDAPPDQNVNKPPNIVLYDYHNSRAAICAQTFLDGYKGYLQVDGYVGYESTDAILIGCWAHARRKFVEAQKIQVKGKTGKADVALSHIQKLYRIEQDIKQETESEKYRIRQQQAKPLLDAFKTWLDTSALHNPPQTAIGKAIHYCLNQWPKLIRYIENGQLSIDNNRAERAIKPFVIGRKNWLFSNTKNGAHASAILYSLCETAKANGLAPFEYLKYLLEQLARNPTNLDDLLPWNLVLSE